MDEVQVDETEQCTNSGLFESIILRNVGSFEDMDEVDEYERLIPDEKDRKIKRELTPNLTGTLTWLSLTQRTQLPSPILELRLHYDRTTILRYQ